jgi:hypothetical protein
LWLSLRAGSHLHPKYVFFVAAGRFNICSLYFSCLWTCHSSSQAVCLFSTFLNASVVESGHSETNIVTAMQSFVIVHTETSPFSALMTHSLPAKILSRVGIKLFFAVEYIFTIDYSGKDAGGRCGCSVDDGREVATAPGPHVRSTVHFFFFHWSHIYALLGMGRIFTFATLVSLRNSWLCWNSSLSPLFF